MNKSSRSLWLMACGSLLFLAAAFMTLRAAEQATKFPVLTHASSALLAAPGSTAPPSVPPSRPPPSAPEESATIKDDPTIAPDPAESADNTVSFPTDI